MVLDLSEHKDEILTNGTLFTEAGMIPKRPMMPAAIGEVQAQGPAAQAGIRAGDRIIAVDGRAIDSWSQWRELVQSRPGQTVAVQVQRGGGSEALQLEIGSRAGSVSGAAVGFAGVQLDTSAEEQHSELRVMQRYGPLEALGRGALETGRVSWLTLKVLGRLVTGDVPLRTLSGPVGIARYAGEAARFGVLSFITFMALVSISLGILNLMPIPVLDGGQMVSQTIEKVRGRPLSLRTQLAVQRVGIGVVLAILCLALFNDISGMLG